MSQPLLLILQGTLYLSIYLRSTTKVCIHIPRFLRQNSPDETFYYDDDEVIIYVTEPYKIRQIRILTEQPKPWHETPLTESRGTYNRTYHHHNLSHFSSQISVFYWHILISSPQKVGKNSLKYWCELSVLNYQHWDTWEIWLRDK